MTKKSGTQKTHPTTYFPSPGAANTDGAVEAARARAVELGLTHVVAATCSGDSALKVLSAFKDAKITVVIVTHHVGFSKEGEDECPAEMRDRIRAEGGVLVTGPHGLSGLERACSSKLGGASRTEAISEAMRSLFGHGLKVCVECTMMAADAGAIPVGPSIEVMALGGRMEGLDTAAVIRPTHTKNFFDMQIKELVAIPREKRDEK